MIDELRTLYRARPFTKAVPFSQTLGADPVPLWSPVNSYFEVGHIAIIGDTPAIDLSFCDSTVGQPFYFIMPSTTQYLSYDLSPGYRSQLASQARLLVFDESNSGIEIKGVILGWEVTNQGYYR